MMAHCLRKTCGVCNALVPHRQTQLHQILLTIVLSAQPEGALGVLATAGGCPCSQVVG